MTRDLSILGEDSTRQQTALTKGGSGMAWRNAFTLIAMAGVFSPGLAFGQGGMGLPGAARTDPRFDVAPQLGEQIPDVTIVDDAGNPVNIRELASRSPYTVLTLGCLT